MEEQYLIYTETTRDLKVSACPAYLEDESHPDQRMYAFAYTITIENFGSEVVQLLGRHWYVYSGGTLYTEVKGDGVVGEQPVIGPGEGYQYTSGSVIKDPTGSMHGTYVFRSEKGEDFEITIPRFDLICPDCIH